MNTTILKPRTARSVTAEGASSGRPRPLTGKVIAITGASSGIGAATARLLAAEGAHVILGARRLDRLARLAGEITVERGSARFHRLDVTLRHDMEAFVAATMDEFGRLDVLVNNAGILLAAPFSALEVDGWGQMIDVNLRGVLHGIAAALPVMRAQGEGHIINLAAIGNQDTAPEMAVYTATKSAVRAVSEGLRQESEHIRVTLVSPSSAFSELGDHIADPVTRCEMRARRSVAISSEAVARAILFAIEQPAEVDVGEIVVRPTANPF